MFQCKISSNFEKEKVYITPLNCRAVSTLPPELSNGLIYPLNYLKPFKQPPERFLWWFCYSSYGFATVTVVLTFLFLFVFAESLKNHSKS